MGELPLLQLTHPVIASLDHPLFAFGVKRVITFIKKIISLRLTKFQKVRKSGINPLFAACSREGDQANRLSGESTARVY